MRAEFVRNDMHNNYNKALIIMKKLTPRIAWSVDEEDKRNTSRTQLGAIDQQKSV